MGDHADRLVLVARTQPREPFQDALASLRQAFTFRRKDEVRRLDPRLVELCVAGARLVQGQPFPAAEVELLERLIRLDLEPVGRRDHRGGIPGSPERARVDRLDRMLLELPGGGLGLRPPDLGQGRIRASLVPALPVPVRFPMA